MTQSDMQHCGSRRADTFGWLQILDQLDLTDATVQNVLLASIPPLPQQSVSPFSGMCLLQASTLIGNATRPLHCLTSRYRVCGCCLDHHELLLCSSVRRVTKSGMTVMWIAALV